MKPLIIVRGRRRRRRRWWCVYLILGRVMRGLESFIEGLYKIRHVLEGFSIIRSLGSIIKSFIGRVGEWWRHDMSCIWEER